MGPRPADKPTVREVPPLVRAYYLRPGNGAGGRLHIVLDDCNVSDADVKYCLSKCVQEGDAEGEALARLLLQMSRTQRAKLSNWRLADGPATR